MCTREVLKAVLASATSCIEIHWFSTSFSALTGQVSGNPWQSILWPLRCLTVGSRYIMTLRESVLKIRTKLGLNDMSTCAASCSSDDIKNLQKDESQTVKTVKTVKHNETEWNISNSSWGLALLRIAGFQSNGAIAPTWCAQVAVATSQTLGERWHDGHGHQEGQMGWSGMVAALPCLLRASN